MMLLMDMFCKTVESAWDVASKRIWCLPAGWIFCGYGLRASEDKHLSVMTTNRKQ